MVNQLYIHNLNVNNSLCLRNSTKLLAESLIWTINSGAIQVMASDLCVSQTCLFLYISQQSLLVKLNQIWHQRLHLNVLDENYLKNLWFDYQRGPSWVGRGVRAEAKIYFSNIVLKNFNHAGFSSEKQNGVQKIQSKNNFSSLLLQRPKIVKVSLVDGLLGCS